MSSSTRPRHARKEIREFADWMADRGWRFESHDHAGHTIWAFAKTGATYKLPETPRRFGVAMQRRTVMRLEGAQPEGKRRAARAKQHAEECRRRREQVDRDIAERAAARATRRRLAAEVAELEEACGYAQAAVRKAPHDLHARLHFNRLRAALRDAVTTARAVS